MSPEHEGTPAGSSPRRRYEFGEFRFDPVSGKLCRDGEAVALAPQPARVLEILLLRAGEVVRREDLYEEVWGDVHVQYGQSLNYCIRQVRIALGEDAKSPRFIETLPRRGYRFLVRREIERGSVRETVASPRGSGSEGTGAPVAEVPGEAGGLPMPGGPPPRRAAFLAGVGAVVVVTTAALFLVAEGGVPGGDLLSDPGADEASSTGVETGVDAGRAPSSLADAGPALQPYLAARYLSSKGAPELIRAIDEYEHALEATPDFAPAHAGLADAYWKLASLGGAAARRNYERSLAAAERALDLGHDTADVHLSRGIAGLYRDLDWEEAAASFDRARRLEPDNARAWFWHARALSATGAHAAAERAAERSLLLDPESRQIVVDLGWFYLLAGRYREAVAQCERALELEPGSVPAIRCLVGANLRLGDRHAAAAAGRDLLEVYAVADPVAARVPAVPEAPEPSHWDRVGDWLGGLCPVNSFAASRAVFYTLAGDGSAAVEQLEFVRDRRYGWAPFIGLDPTFAELRDEPGFQALVGSSRFGASGTGD